MLTHQKCGHENVLEDIPPPQKNGFFSFWILGINTTVSLNVFEGSSKKRDWSLLRCELLTQSFI